MLALMLIERVEPASPMRRELASTPLIEKLLDQNSVIKLADRSRHQAFVTAAGKLGQRGARGYHRVEILLWMQNLLRRNRRPPEHLSERALIQLFAYGILEQHPLRVRKHQRPAKVKGGGFEHRVLAATRFHGAAHHLHRLCGTLE